ncbi:hypothetical protein BCR33DRAFT_716439 [Rhizoclosmatium globosum]|uniref:Uncharacterized protein n=1 Tax=Rhizoclosmatium globosum TaxID=329046 RepID=A0A1Y2CDG7_9FUNG|nr:hypothetical protein BCR33DRAFT_716439 [Rhizoclosmatium globosum]|eukprot:ORY45098.1 hypothetical protein BCR33DRAFT_716439 [Rhizoclosmatium globosum]
MIGLHALHCSCGLIDSLGLLLMCLHLMQLGIENFSIGTNFVQYPPSGIGYNAADIFCDWFATVVSITFTWKYMNSNVTRIGEIVLQDNVFRSIVILIVNSYAIYLSSVNTGPFAPMVYLGQGYVYTRSVNLELLWIYLRKRSMNLSANSHESIKNTIQASSQRLAESRRQSAPVLSAVEERDSDIRESDNLRISRSKSHAMFASLGRTADSLQSPMLKARSISSSIVSKSPSMVRNKSLGGGLLS